MAMTLDMVQCTVNWQGCTVCLGYHDIKCSWSAMMFSTKGKVVRSVKPPPSSAQSGVTHGGRISNPVQAFLYRYNLGYNRNPPPGSYKLPHNLPEPYRLHDPKYNRRNYQKRRSCFCPSYWARCASPKTSSSSSSSSSRFDTRPPC
jgi:hypothetical protein